METENVSNTQTKREKMPRPLNGLKSHNLTTAGPKQKIILVEC